MKKNIFSNIILIMIILEPKFHSYYYFGFSLIIYFGINFLNLQLAKFQNSVSYKSKILGQNFNN